MNSKLIPLVIFLVSSFIANANTSSSLGDSIEQAGKTILVVKKPSEQKRPLGLQSTAESEPKKNTYKRFLLSNLGVSGYIRSYNQYRHLPIRYPGQPAAENLITVQGLDIVNNAVTGYNEPLFLLRLEGAPTVNTTFKLEYMFDHQMTGIFNEPPGAVIGGPASSGTRRAMIYRILQFTGTTHTKIGDFKMIAGGGVNWYRLSPFTLWNYQYRDDMFERYPWQPEGSGWSLYNSYYGTQSIPRDARWGNTGTQGFILEGKNLPLGLGFSALYGKTDNSGGFQSYLNRTPKSLLAGRLERSFGRNLIGINYFSQFGYTDAVGKYRVRQQILTADGRLNFKNLKIYVEGGVGRYQDSIVAKTVHVGDSTYTNESISGKNEVQGLNYNWAPAFNIDIETAKELTFIPLKLTMYYVSKNVVNVNSAVLNSANPHALANLNNVGTPSDITTFRGAVTDIGQLTNNRMGGYLKYEGNVNKLKVILATGISQEIENLYDTVSFWHQANAFTRSRFAYYASYLGPYNRITSIFRRTYENIGITDTSKSYKKGYNTIDITLKYKLRIFNRELILSNYIDYNSVQSGMSAIPKFNDKAFIRTFYEEVMAFYALHPKVTVLGFFGFERVLGNMDTELADESGNKIVDAAGNVTKAPNGSPINQTGHGYGIGIDYDFSGRAGLYLRHRWFDHKDKNFTKDQFRGMESTVELKIFF